MNKQELFRWAHRDMQLDQTKIETLWALAQEDECEFLDLVWNDQASPAPADTSALVLPDDFFSEAL